MRTSTITLIQNEVARAKHPNGCYLAALMEEVGEASQAMMQQGSASERAQEELVQVAATAIRLIEEPDQTLLEPVEDCVEEKPNPGFVYLTNARELATEDAMAVLVAHSEGPNPSWPDCPANQFEGGCPHRAGLKSCKCQ